MDPLSFSRGKSKRRVFIKNDFVSTENENGKKKKTNGKYIWS